MIDVYGISNCDTIRKTLRWLDENSFQYRLHDYRREGIDQDLVRRFMAQFSLEQLINRRGTTWRKLPPERRDNLAPESAIELMLENPALIKRPILTDGNHWLIGFDAQALSQTLI